MTEATELTCTHIYIYIYYKYLLQLCCLSLSQLLVIPDSESEVPHFDKG